MDSVSVIIPTFNREKLLHRALTSVFKQTHQNFEVLVVDDGSIDETAAMIKKYFPKVRYFFQRNRGVSAARNLGIKNAGGDLIAFLDSDDEWLPSKLEKQIQFLNSSSLSWVQSREKWIRQDKEIVPGPKHQMISGMIFNQSCELCLVSPSAVMMEKKLFKRYGMFDETLPACEDYDFWLRILAYEPIGLIEDPLTIHYGGHPDQLSQKYWGMDRFRIKALVKILKMPLTAMQRHKVKEILIFKLNVLAGGALKRRKLFSFLKYGLLKFSKLLF
jgi:glycosyltransferase involved in cell wall biosynthesis